MDKVQTVVIGAGVIGLSCARALAKAGHEVILIERCNSIGQGTSSRNSEVVHAGIYYPKDSLKAKLCVRGRQMLYQFCDERHVDYNKCGKLIVATESDPNKVSWKEDENASVKLKELYRSGLDNGVHDLKLISKEEVFDLEPNVHCSEALWSPSTGVVDSHSFMLSLLADAEEHGAMLALNCKVQNIRYNYQTNRNEVDIVDVNDDDDYKLCRHSESNASSVMRLSCENVVNAAGLNAPEISGQMTGAVTASSLPKKHYFAKGNYFRLTGQQSPFSKLVYPVPEPGGLGVHATIDLEGQCRFGPDVEWIDPEVNVDEINYDVNSEKAKVFYSEIRKYWPDLSDEALEPDCKSH